MFTGAESRADGNSIDSEDGELPEEEHTARDISVCSVIAY